MGFQTPTKIKMQHTNQAELNQLYGTFCRVWAAGGQATLSTTSLEDIVTAKLEVKLGQLGRGGLTKVIQEVLADQKKNYVALFVPKRKES